MKKITALLTLVLSCFSGGCQLGKVVGLIGTPTSSEKKIPAEHDISQYSDSKILILVEQPGWLVGDANLRFYLTDAIKKNLVKTTSLEDDNFVGYNDLSNFRSSTNDYSSLLPAEIGKALNAKVVLLIMIENYKLKEMAHTNYYNGFLGSQAVIFDTSSGKKLWPENANSRNIRVGFDVEKHGKEFAIARLIRASAYCTIRLLYDCPKNKFKIIEDRTGIAWQHWQ